MKAFITHVVLLDQAFAHCPKFLTAALGAGALFNSGVAVRSHKPAGDHRFGGPLPITNFLIPGRIDRRRINLLVVHPFRMELSTCAPLYPVLESRTEGLTTLPLLTRTPSSRMGSAEAKPSAEPSTSMC